MCGDVLVILCRYYMVRKRREKKKKKKKKKKKRKKEEKEKEKGENERDSVLAILCKHGTVQQERREPAPQGRHYVM